MNKKKEIKKIYRNANIKDLFSVYFKGIIEPYFFEGSFDSTATKGVKSFWFAEKIIISEIYTDIIIESEINENDIDKSIMSFSYEENNHGTITIDYYEVDEITVNSNVSVNAILISKHAEIPDDIDFEDFIINDMGITIDQYYNDYCYWQDQYNDFVEFCKKNMVCFEKIGTKNIKEIAKKIKSKKYQEL